MDPLSLADVFGDKHVSMRSVNPPPPGCMQCLLVEFAGVQCKEKSKHFLNPGRIFQRGPVSEVKWPLKTRDATFFNCLNNESVIINVYI